MIVLDQELLEQVLRNIREAALREGSTPEPECFPVWLHVYDLGYTTKYVLNNWVSKMSGFGAFHCGIEVLGAEWSFQAPSSAQTDKAGDERTGLMCHKAKVHPVHVYRESICLGDSTMRVADIWSTIIQLERKWPANSYHVVRRNCTDFAEEFATSLQVKETIPAWVHGIAKGWLRQTPLANVESTILPQSCASSVVSISESGSSKNSPNDNDKKLPIHAAGANGAPPFVPGSPRMLNRRERGVVDPGGSSPLSPSGPHCSSQVFILPVAQSPKPAEVSFEADAATREVKLLKIGGSLGQDSGWARNQMPPR